MPAERLAIAREYGPAVLLHARSELIQLLGCYGFGELGRGKTGRLERHALALFRAFGFGCFGFFCSHAPVLARYAARDGSADGELRGRTPPGRFQALRTLILTDERRARGLGPVHHRVDRLTGGETALAKGGFLVLVARRPV